MKTSLSDVTMNEAAEMLGVSRPKVRRLVQDGLLQARQNPLDRRVWLIPRRAVLQLKSDGKSPVKLGRREKTS